MPRKRMIDPSFWRDEKIGKCSLMERLLFIGLWTFAEDDGVGRANPLLIKADVFPYETLREADIKKSLDKLSSLGLIQIFDSDGQSYYFVRNFKKHQTINKPSTCYLPLPPPLPEDYGSAPVVVTSEDKRSKENIYTPVVTYLNEKAGTNFREDSRKTREKIDARVKEGYSLDDFKRVIDIKCTEWNHPPRSGEKDMRPFLRPETLFGPKFESYLNQGNHNQNDGWERLT